MCENKKKKAKTKKVYIKGNYKASALIKPLLIDLSLSGRSGLVD